MEIEQKPVCVADLLQVWLAELRKTARPTSFTVYQNEVQNHILPALGQRPLRELSRETGEELAEALAAKGLSRRTAKDVAGKLGQALRWGADRGYDVPILKELPLERETRELRFLTEDESERLAASLSGGDDNLINLILLTWRAGLTIGEACALTYGDIDWLRESLTVRRLCQRVTGGLSYTEVEPRTLPLPAGLRAEDAAEREFVVRSSRGGGVEPRLCQIWLKKHLKQAGLSEDIGFAVLRNSYIRELMSGGADFIEVSRLTGCRDLNELWRKYGAYYRRSEEKCGK